jgi:hypothetical protein
MTPEVLGLPWRWSIAVSFSVGEGFQSSDLG